MLNLFAKVELLKINKFKQHYLNDLLHGLNRSRNNVQNSHKSQNQNIEMITWLHVAFGCCLNMHQIYVAYKIELTLGHLCTFNSTKPMLETYIFSWCKRMFMMEYGEANSWHVCCC